MDYEEETHTRTIVPTKKHEDHFMASEVKIIKKADPEKLAQLHKEKREIEARLKKAGIKNPQGSFYGRRNSL